MKLIKLGLFSFILIFLLITAISLFIPSTITLSKATRLRATKQELMQQLANPDEWKNWFPGADTMQVLMIEGKPQGLILNEKKQRTLLINESSDTAVRAVYQGISKNVTTGWNVLHGASTDSVSVQWYMQFKLRWYPWEKFASLLFEKQYGTQMEMGLNKLKAYLEKE